MKNSDLKTVLSTRILIEKKWYLLKKIPSNGVLHESENSRIEKWKQI